MDKLLQFLFLIEVLRCDAFGLSKKSLTPIRKTAIQSHIMIFQGLLNYNADPLQRAQLLNVSLIYDEFYHRNVIFTSIYEINS
jgi:hypothetical protein